MRKKIHYHTWCRQTRGYRGTYSQYEKDESCEDPTRYIYEEYEPPPCPDPDGYYVVNIPGKSRPERHIVRKEGNDLFYLTGASLSVPWIDCLVVAEVPEVVWCQGKPNGSGKW